MATQLISDMALLDKVQKQNLEAYRRTNQEDTPGDEQWVVWKNGLPHRVVKADSRQKAFEAYFEKTRS